MIWRLTCTITVIHGQQYLDHRKTAATGVPHWHDAPPRIDDETKVLHRSHNFSAAALTADTGGARLGRTRRNVVSCAVENPDYATIWYDDAALDKFLDDAASIDARIAAAIDALRKPPLKHFVLRTDLARLLLVHTYGGWWLDADLVCIDDPLAELEIEGCVFAWEGSVADEPSAPLNWAFACEKGHELPLRAALLAADRIAAFSGDAGACAGEKRAYCAGGIPVLDLTGPAMLGDALRAYTGASSNRALREAAGERADDASTWARATTVKDVTVLPYCYFRSRGCPHLAGADVVFFHHEFDTAWRPAFWHNHYPGSGGEL